MGTRVQRMIDRNNKQKKLNLRVIKMQEWITNVKRVKKWVEESVRKFMI